ncbi:MAG: flagellar biosynthesis protein FlgK [Naasia sp.]|nr:flagellar biosynthesis protein FlgK [Naasia sp.]
MSTFGSLNTAYSGLQAARAAMDVVGQNIANATTEGYTRQRVTQSPVGSVAAQGVFRTGVNIGQGVQLTGIARLGDSILDTRVRNAASTMGYWEVASAALTTIEVALNEPGENGLSSTLADFWSAWQNVANNAGDPGRSATLLAQAQQLTSRIAEGYTQAANGWSNARLSAEATVQTVNDAAAKIADLNAQIRSTRASGGSANELIDQRSVLATSLANSTGATVRENTDNTIDLVLGGNALVSGTSARTLHVGGATAVTDDAPVVITWDSKVGATVDVNGGKLAGYLATLAPADDAGNGTGGPWAESAALYNSLAAKLHETVNAAHETGTLPGGGTGAFFALTPGVPFARGLTVLPTDASGIAAGTGGRDGSVADTIAALAASPDGADARWSRYVIQVGVLSSTAIQQSTLSVQATTVASTAQSSQSAVDMDEETTNLLMYQHAYQGAARVMTAIDEMLDVLINRTGLVGR